MFDICDTYEPQVQFTEQMSYSNKGDNCFQEKLSHTVCVPVSAALWQKKTVKNRKILIQQMKEEHLYSQKL